MLRPLLLGGCAALCWGDAAGAQIRVRNAGVPSPQVPQLTWSTEFTATEREDRTRLLASFAWSPDGKTAFEVDVPFVHLDAEFAGTSDDATGLGDVRARAQRSLFQSDGVLSSRRLAAWAGIHLPTGDDDALRSEAGVYPRLLQPGMGAFGAGGGVAYTWIQDRHRFAANLGAHWMDEASGFQMGTEVTAALSYWYRLTPAVFDREATEHQLEVRPVIELIGTQRFESERLGRGTDDDGLLAWIAPGVQAFVAEDLLVQASVALPIANGIDDPLGEREWSALLSLRWYF